MKVIGAGAGRTGTLSLKAALERLGFGPCYHMSVLLDRPTDIEVWDAAAKGDLSRWGELFGEFQSTTDAPGCLFWRELADAYPNAQVILGIRDPEQWYDSVRRTVVRPDIRAAVASIAPQVEAVLPALLRRFGNLWDRDEAIDAFNRHNQAVRDGIPAERLLTYEVVAGWGPLCEFLGVPEPNEPFPHLNEAETLERRVRERARHVPSD